MSVGGVLLGVLGAALLGAGLWWIGGGRWKWLPRPPARGVSLPTRMAVGLVHLVLGYHLIVWMLPVENGPLQLPREWWLWVVLGCAVAVAGSVGMDRLEGRKGES